MVTPKIERQEVGNTAHAQAVDEVARGAPRNAGQPASSAVEGLFPHQQNQHDKQGNEREHRKICAGMRRRGEEAEGRSRILHMRYLEETRYDLDAVIERYTACHQPL